MFIIVAGFLAAIYAIFKSIENKQKEETESTEPTSLSNQTMEELLALKNELEVKQNAVINLKQSQEIKTKILEIDAQLETLINNPSKKENQ
jgi:hypothetical protein